MNQREAVEFFEHRAGGDRRQAPRRMSDQQRLEDVANARKVRAFDDIVAHLQSDEADNFDRLKQILRENGADL
jgi:hypothetical protein